MIITDLSLLIIVSDDNNILCLWCVILFSP